MRKMLAFSVAAVMAAAVLPASADTTSEDRMLKAPQKSMGDQGKLPATDHLSNSVPEMGTHEPGDANAGPSGPKGPAKRMGDQGKLPATNSMSGAVPRMSPGSN